MKVFQKFLVLLAVLLVGVSAFAQTTASLTGKVTLDGNPLPGATVTISSPNLLGTRTTTTDVNGNYNFGGIPAGDYTVKFEMESMQSVTKTAHIGLGQTGRADSTMKLSTVAESITVTASAPAVLETTEIQANVPQKLVDELPMGRRLQDAALLTPGVNNNGPNAGTSITISGAPAYDSVFMVNGAVINENLRGQAHNLFIEDAIQETTVLTGAISAEYGRFTGGVVNAITKSGGNEFHGSLRDSLTNDKWTSINKQFYTDAGVSQPSTDPRIDKINPVYEGTFGGRIIRDRLWFFLAGRQAKISSGRNFTVSPVPGSDNPGLPYTFVDDNKRYEGKLTGQITPQHTLVGSYLDIKNPQTNNCFTPCLEVADLDLQRSLPNSFYSIHYNGILTNSLLVEGNYSKKKFAFVGSGGDFRDFDNGTAWYDNNSGSFFGAPVFCGVCDNERRDNDLWSAKGTYYLASKGFGTHNLVAGVENWKETRFSNNYQSGSNYFLQTFDSPLIKNGVSYPTFIHDQDIIQYSPIRTLSKGSSFQTFSAYANDKWDFNPHFSFNLGVRYDKNDGKDSSGATVTKDKNISPRLGMIYDFQGNGRYRLNASFSKYVSKVQETVGGSGTAAGNPDSIYYIYEGPDINTDHSMTFVQVAHAVKAWFDSVGGTTNSDLIIGARLSGVNQIIGNDLKSPSVTEYTLGLGSQLGTNGFVRFDYTHRDWNDFYALFRNQALGHVQDSFGVTYDLGVVGNSNDFDRKYNAATIQASYRPWQRVDLGGNYTYATLKGNVTAETAGSGPVSEAKFSYPEFKAFAQNNPIGYLPSDQRHKVRAWVAYDLPTFFGKWNFSLLQRYDSGLPYSLSTTIRVQKSATCPSCPDPATLTYATPPTTATYFFSKRGEFRLDDVMATDLAINYELPISKVSLFAQSDIINIFNRQAQAFGINNTITVIKRFDQYKETPVEGVNWVKSANFGKPLNPTTGSNTNGSYQLPRTYRISFGVRF